MTDREDYEFRPGKTVAQQMSDMNARAEEPMTDRIDPALTPEEWKRAIECAPCGGTGAYLYENDPPGPCPSCDGTGRAVLQNLTDQYFSANGDADEPDESDLPAIIALANAALPDDDPRKITRDDVANLRAIITREDVWAVAKSDIVRLAAVLASYLPPE